MAEQEEIDAALDAALDELDDDDDDDDYDEEDKEKSVEAVRGAAMTFDTDAVASNIESTQNKNDKPAAAATTTAAAETKPKPVVMGPPRPPVPPPAAPSAPLPPFQIPDSSSSMDGDEEQFFAEMMAQVQSQFGSNGDCTSNANEPPEAFLERLMQEMQSQLQSEVKQQQPQPPASSSSARCTNSKANIKDKNGDKIKKTAKKANEVDQAISNLIQDMAKKSNQDDDGDDNSAVDRDEMNGDPEAAMLQQLIKGLGELGSGGLGSDSGGGGINADAMIDGMMEQLMSKDLMYEPMKQVADKFPQWLQERRTVLSLDEYAK
jgi:peroxin-19